MTAIASQSQATRCVDLTGEVCPMTFVRTRIHLDRITTGEAIEFILNGGDQLRGVAVSLKEEGHRVESVCRENGRHRVLVRKHAASEA